MSFLSKLWASIKSLFTGLEVKSKVWIHIAIDAIQGLKTAMDNGAVILNVIDSITKDEWGTHAVAIVKEWVPKVLLELNMVAAIADLTNVDDQLKAILAKLKLSDDATRNIVWHGLASLIIDKLSDGKFSWADSVAVAQYYYDHILDTPEAVTTAQIVEVATQAA